jgi:guanine deaminase
MKRYTCEARPDPERRAFFNLTAMVAAAGVAVAAGLAARPANATAAGTTPADQRKYMQEATNLAIESVEKGWGGPFGAVIVKDGEIIGRGRTACC